MGSVYYPNQFFETKACDVNGQTSQITATVYNPYIMFKVNNITYPNGFTVNYQGGFRRFYAVVDANKNLYITCYTIAYGEDIPAYTLSGVELYVAGQATASVPGEIQITGNPYTYSTNYYTNPIPWKVNLIWTGAVNAVSYRVYVRQSNSNNYQLINVPYTIQGNIVVADFLLNSYINYQPGLLLYFMIATVAEDAQEYTYAYATLADSLGITETMEHYIPGRTEWLEDRGDGQYFGTQIMWNGSLVAQFNDVSENVYINFSDGYTYYKGATVYSVMEGNSANKVSRRVTPAGTAIGVYTQNFTYWSEDRDSGQWIGTSIYWEGYSKNTMVWYSAEDSYSHGDGYTYYKGTAVGPQYSSGTNLFRIYRQLTGSGSGGGGSGGGGISPDEQ